MNADSDGVPPPCVQVPAALMPKTTGRSKGGTLSPPRTTLRTTGGAMPSGTGRQVTNVGRGKAY